MVVAVPILGGLDPPFHTQTTPNLVGSMFFKSLLREMVGKPPPSPPTMDGGARQRSSLEVTPSSIRVLQLIQGQWKR
jgi:hypothetical protein